MRITMLLRNPFTRDARVLREARSLARAGHEVTVIAIRTPELPREEMRDGFRVLRLVEAKPWMGPTILGGGTVPPPLAGTRSASGGRLGTAGRRLSRPPAAVVARDVAMDRAFTAAARQVPADAVHAHDLNTLTAGATVSREAGIPLVYDAHELYPDLTGLGNLERRRWRAIEGRLIRRAAAVIAPTDARGAVLNERYGVSPVVVMNCPDPPDPSADEPRLAELRRPGEVLVAYAGGFTPNRGLGALVLAAGELDGVRLAMLGWGPREEELRTQAAPFGDRIVFAGAVEPDLVVAACSHADIGVVTYEAIGLNNALAAPNKLFEYLHAGLAVAGSDLPDVRAVIERHDVGATFEAGNPASIKQALAGLRDGDLAGMRARSAGAAGAYTWDAQAEKLLAIYDRLSSSS